MAKKVLDFEQQINEIDMMINKLKGMSGSDSREIQSEIASLQEKYQQQKKELYNQLSPWQIVQIARHPERPVLQHYLEYLFDEFSELHGDRCFSDDRALIGGFAKLENHRVMLIGHNKGTNVKENVERNFGCALPDGYRKALRLMKIAEKYGLPIITFIDTQGAYPGKDAEERGQAEAIAKNLMEMARLEVPIISVVTGEGGSGGALGIGVGDVILMLSYSIYSVISPEGCASILWRDAAFAPQAAEAMKITAKSLLELEVIEEIIQEPLGGAHNDYKAISESIKEVLLKYLAKLTKMSSSKLINKRFEKYSKIGKFTKLS